VKITDFGISRAAGSAAVTGTGELLGTPAYLAPERLAGRAATPASDLYSLGVVAWECLAGAPPFTGPPVEVALAHRDRLPPPLPGAVPASVAALVAELTAKDPLARPPGAGEVASRAGRLRDATNSRATLPLGIEPGPLAAPARPDPVRHGRRARGSMRPGWAAALGAGALIAGVLLAILVAGMLNRAGSQARTTSPSAAPSRMSAAATVEGSPGSLAGQPVDMVRRQLQQLGLVVRVLWQPGGQDPGTVLSVQPTGRVPAGRVITVTAAAPPNRDGHGHGDGQGNGAGGD